MSFTVKNKVTGKFAKVIGCFVTWSNDSFDLTQDQLNIVKYTVNEARITVNQYV
jgi:hypothetical protein